MGPHIATEIFRTLLVGIMMTMLFGAVASWAWAIRRMLRAEPLLPEAPIIERRAAPWGLGTIVLIWVAYVFVSYEAFGRLGRDHRADRPEGQAAALARDVEKKDAPGAPEPSKAGPEHAPEDESLPHGRATVELMSIQGAISAFFIILLPVLARLTSGARLRDLGVSRREWRRQASVGVVAVLFLMPIVYAIQAACIFYLAMPDVEREKFKHPLEKMLRDHFSPGVAAVAFVTAVILAPLFEELLFRGFMQSWLVKVFERLPARLRASLADPIKPSKGAPLPQSSSGDGTSLFDPSLDSPPGYWEAADEPPAADRPDSPTPDAGSDEFLPVWPGLSFGAAAGITLTSMLFAALHAPQWPAPIPLFVLAMGLGVVYHRTGSLLTPICMHAAFNGFSTLMLFIAALQAPDQEKPPARPVLERVAPEVKPGTMMPIADPGSHRRASSKSAISRRIFVDDRPPD